MADPGPGAAQMNQVVVAQAQDDPDALFGELLRQIRSDDFDGNVKVEDDEWSEFTDAKAEELGLALLQKKNEIKTLSFPICSLLLQACPAFLEYFETSMPSVKLNVDGSDIDEEEQTPVTSSEILDILLQKLAMQDRVMPRIQLTGIVLSTASLLYLKTFQIVFFICCDLSGDHDSSRLAVIPATDASQTIMDRRYVVFEANTSFKLIKASQCLLMAKLCCVAMICEPDSTDNKRRIDSVVALAKSIKVAEKVVVCFKDLDTDGSLVAETLMNLSLHAKVVPMAVHISWEASEGPIAEAVRQRAPEILEIISHCRFIHSSVTSGLSRTDRFGTSIFDANQSKKMEEIALLNLKIPQLVDTKPQEFWMQNLVVLKALLTPDRLLHPRFREVYYRLLRRNFYVLHLLMECYRPPSPATSGPASRTRLRRAAALRDEKKRKSPPKHVQYDGPARRTRLRSRADAQS